MLRQWTALGAVGALLAVAAVGRASPTFFHVAIPARVARAHSVVVGKVTAIEPKTVSADQHFEGRKADFKVAVVEVEEVVSGAKVLKRVRVGFVPPTRRGLGRPPNQALAVGQEACFFLTPHGKESFFVVPWYFDVLLKADNPSFKDQVALARRGADVLARPDAGLKSKKKEERLLIAGMLLLRYRTPPHVAVAQRATEPIPAAQSRLILQALAEADWARPLDKYDDLLDHPRVLFYALNPTAKDGWEAPADAREFTAAAHQWVKDNVGKYRIQRFVVKPPKKK